MPSARQLHIKLFGYLRLTFENQPIAGLQTERYQSLLAYFVLKARSPIPRSQLAALFWPNVPETKAKASLRRELYKIKQILPEAGSFLKVTPRTVQWQPQIPFWLDVTEFEAKIEQAAQLSAKPADQIDTLKQAVALYEGDLLFTCYDDWIEPTRNRLHKFMVSALAKLACLLRDLEEYRGAISYTQQLLQLEPVNEAGYLRLMQLYVLQGDRASALQTYHQCMTLLNGEMGILPSAQTRQFYEELLRDVPSSYSPVIEQESLNQTSLNPDERKAVSSSDLDISQGSDQALIQERDQPHIKPELTPVDWGEAPDTQRFYGRSMELAQLTQWIRADRCRLVAVLGVGGIGKTALAAKVTHDLQGDFDLIIWRSLRNAPPLEVLLEDLISFLSSQQDNTASIAQLMHWLRQSRCLIVLDNVETLSKGGERAGQYLKEYENYGELLSVVGQAAHKSCLLLTSRESPFEVATFSGDHLAIRALQIEGSSKAALALVETKALVGSFEEKAQLCDRYGDNPLSVQIISSAINDVFGGEINLFLAEYAFMLTGVKYLLDLQFERLTPLEKTVMTWLYEFVNDKLRIE